MNGHLTMTQVWATMTASSKPSINNALSLLDMHLSLNAFQCKSAQDQWSFIFKLPWLYLRSLEIFPYYIYFMKLIHFLVEFSMLCFFWKKISSFNLTIPIWRRYYSLEIEVLHFYFYSFYTKMNWLIFGVCIAVDFGLQIIFGVIAIIMKTEKFYDLIGSLTYISITLLSLL